MPTSAIVKSIHDLDTIDVSILRQKVIVQLLRKSTLEPQDLAEYVRDFIQHQVLTHDVCDEVRELLIEQHDLGMNCNQPKENSSQPHAATSRFEHEFERLELLGRGAFGEVWRARSRVDHREYAIKMVPYSFDGAEGPFEHPALREAQTWASFQHPNAVRYHAAWVEVDSKPAAHALTSQGKLLAPGKYRSEKPSSKCNTCDELFDYSSGLSSTGSDVSDGGVVFEAFSTSTGAREEEEETSGGPSLSEAKVQIAHCEAPEQPKVKNVQRAVLYVQTELVKGGTLRHWIDERNAAFVQGADPLQRQMSCKMAEDIFRQVVDVVCSLHSQNICHRDLKPSNIYIAENGSVRLGDFGLAKEMSTEASSDHPLPILDEMSGQLSTTPQNMHTEETHTRGVGTPTYASPEQLQKRQYGVQADIYALGMLLAELLVPVQTCMERAALFEGLRALQLPPEVDDLCANAGSLVLQMISVRPEDRPSAHELSVLMKQRATQPFPIMSVGVDHQHQQLCPDSSSVCYVEA